MSLTTPNTLSESIFDYGLFFLVYIILSTRLVLFYFQGESIYFIPVFTFILLIIFYQSKIFISALILCFKYLSFFCIYFFIAFFSSNYYFYSLEKIQGFLLVPLIATPLIVSLLVKYSTEEFFKKFLTVSLSILILTLLYKYFFGFFDRGVRFFINGPIAFSWMMGLSALISVHLYLRNTTQRIWMLLFVVFSASIFWAESKGPIIALLVTVFALMLFKLRARQILMLLTALSVIYYVLTQAEISILQGRLRAITQIFDANIDPSNQGSIGIRLQAYFDSFQMFLSSPLLGVGLNNWATYSETGLTYPHNFILEIASEGGLVLLIPIIILLLSVFWKTTNIGRFILIYFALCLSFSGDLPYLGVMISLPLSFIFVKKLRGF